MMETRSSAPAAAADPERPPEPELDVALHGYRLRFARTPGERDAVFRLRYEVFNVELGEGLEASRASGLDRDAYDAQCAHLCVEDSGGAAIGTYRLQTAETARAGAGFYSASEFDLAPLASVLPETVEMGRACIARAHRSRSVLFLLWRGILAYVRHHRKRYLFGCSSITSQDPAEGRAVHRWLAEHGHLHPTLEVPPLAGYACPPSARQYAGEPTLEASIPTLFDIYLRYGARIVSPPALDRTFGTIDFLTFLDLDGLDRRVRRAFEGA